MKLLFTFFISIFLFNISYSQSAWTKEKNAGYFQLQYNTIPEYDEIYGISKDNSLFPERLQTEMGINLYGEFGITDKITLIGHIPVKIHKSGDINPKVFLPTVDIDGPFTESGTLTALGNIEIGGRYNLYNSTYVVSGQLNVELNTSTFDSDLGLRTGYDAYAFTPTINVGRGWSKSYIQAFTGFTLRTNDYHQSFKFGVEYGYKVLPKLWAIGFIDVLHTVDDADLYFSFNTLTTSNYINNQEYIAFGLKVNYDYNDNFGINFGFGGAFHAELVPKKPSMAIGIFSKI